MALYQIFTTTIRSTISENLVLLAETWVTVQDGGYQFLALPFFTLLEILMFIKHKKKIFNFFLRLLHTMNVRFSLLDIAQRILGVTLPNFQ